MAALGRSVSNNLNARRARFISLRNVSSEVYKGSDQVRTITIGSDLNDELNKESQHEEWKRANKIRHVPEETIVETAMATANIQKSLLAGSHRCYRRGSEWFIPHNTKGDDSRILGKKRME
jgi:hypothetical protein